MKLEDLAAMIVKAIQDSVDEVAGFKGARFSLDGTGWTEIAESAVIDVLQEVDSRE